MNWLLHFLQSSIGKKILVTLTGLFLCLFLVIHLYGNLNLILDSSGKAFNQYSFKMSNSAFIKLSAYVTYAFIILHVVVSLALTAKNKQARPVGYKKIAGDTSFWNSRNMGILGTLVLAFLVFHMSKFWYRFKFGVDLPTTENYAGGVEPMTDYFAVVSATFSQWWIVLLYVLSMIPIAFHLAHGFQSAFRTLGIVHPKHSPVIAAIGYAFSILIPLAFALIPIIVYSRVA